MITVNQLNCGGYGNARCNTIYHICANNTIHHDDDVYGCTWYVYAYLIFYNWRYGLMNRRAEFITLTIMLMMILIPTIIVIESVNQEPTSKEK